MAKNSRPYPSFPAQRPSALSFHPHKKGPPASASALPPPPCNSRKDLPPPSESLENNLPAGLSFPNPRVKGPPASSLLPPPQTLPALRVKRPPADPIFPNPPRKKRPAGLRQRAPRSPKPPSGQKRKVQLFLAHPQAANLRRLAGAVAVAARGYVEAPLAAKPQKIGGHPLVRE